MDAAGSPIQAAAAAADNDSCGPSGSRDSLLGFFARRRGTRPPSPSRAEHALSWASSRSRLASSSARTAELDAEVVGSGASSSDAAARSLDSPARRKVGMDRRRGRGGDWMSSEVVRAVRYGGAYHAAGKVAVAMDLLNHKPM